MQTKQLMTIEGKESYMQLKILLRYEFKHTEEGKYMPSPYNKICIPPIRAHSEIRKSQRKIRTKLVAINLYIEQLTTEYYNILNKTDQKIENAQDTIQRIRQDMKEVLSKVDMKTNKKRAKEIQTSYRKDIKKQNDIIRRLLMQRKGTPNTQIPIEVIEDVIKKIPNRYKTQYEKEIEYKPNKSDCIRLKLYMTDINPKAIPYLEQQQKLARIQLSEEEGALVIAFKEVLRMTKENNTFENYIDNWAERLLNEFERGAR